MSIGNYQDYGAPLPHQQRSSVVWLDVNTRFGIENNTELLSNIRAINNGLYNLLRCPIGARGPIGEPEFGVYLYQFLYDPLDDITAHKIRISFIQSIQRWETRITLDMSNTWVKPLVDLPGYNIRVAYQIVSLQQDAEASFNLIRGQVTQ